MAKLEQIAAAFVRHGECVMGRYGKPACPCAKRLIEWSYEIAACTDTLGTRNLCGVAAVEDVQVHRHRQNGQDRFSGGLVCLCGQCNGPRRARGSDRPSSSARKKEALAHRLPETGHPYGGMLRGHRSGAPGARVGKMPGECASIGSTGGWFWFDRLPLYCAPLLFRNTSCP